MSALRVALLLALLLPVACRDEAERRAAAVAGLREDAAEGIAAVEAFCTARDTVIARAERGEPGEEIVLRQVLLAPVVLDDYCEEFRYHEHDEDDEHNGHDEAGAAADTSPGDRVQRDTARTTGREGGG